MGKNAKRRKAEKEAQREALRAARGAVPRAQLNLTGMRQTERETVQMIAMLSDPSNPPCPGPVAIHVDGAFECTAGCEGVRFAYHDTDSVAPCPAGATELGHSCDRCAGIGRHDGALWCPATEIEHGDGTVTCELGDECAGTGALHASGMSCSVRALAGTPCPRCG